MRKKMILTSFIEGIFTTDNSVRIYDSGAFDILDGHWIEEDAAQYLSEDLKKYVSSGIVGFTKPGTTAKVEVHYKLKKEFDDVKQINQIKEETYQMLRAGDLGKIIQSQVHNFKDKKFIVKPKDYLEFTLKWE